jgi:hypothetical protein
MPRIAVGRADADRIDGHRVAASLRFGLLELSFRADPPAKQITASGSSCAATALGARSFWTAHSRNLVLLGLGFCTL